MIVNGAAQPEVTSHQAVPIAPSGVVQNTSRWRGVWLTAAIAEGRIEVAPEP